jgi:methionyl-tRNA formyltransferase
MSIILFCPNPYSLYTNSICELLKREGYNISFIFVRRFTFERFLLEFQRDGKRIFRKIWNKLVLKNKAYDFDSYNIVKFRNENNLTISHVKFFENSGTKVIYCNNLNDLIVLQNLKKLSEKLIVFTGGGIIRKNILDNAGHGILNCHMGVLPKYKGMDLPEWCLLENNSKDLGITVHFMDSGIDTGNLLRVVPIELLENDNIKKIRSRFEPIMVSTMVNTIKDYLAGDITPYPQPKDNGKQYFIVHKRLYNLVNKKIIKNRN